MDKSTSAGNTFLVDISTEESSSDPFYIIVREVLKKILSEFGRKEYRRSSLEAIQYMFENEEMVKDLFSHDDKENDYREIIAFLFFKKNSVTHFCQKKFIKEILKSPKENYLTILEKQDINQYLMLVEIICEELTKIPFHLMSFEQKIFLAYIRGVPLEDEFFNDLFKENPASLVSFIPLLSFFQCKQLYEYAVQKESGSPLQYKLLASLIPFFSLDESLDLVSPLMESLNVNNASIYKAAAEAVEALILNFSKNQWGQGIEKITEALTSAEAMVSMGIFKLMVLLTLQLSQNHDPLDHFMILIEKACSHERAQIQIEGLEAIITLSPKLSQAQTDQCINLIEKGCDHVNTSVRLAGFKAIAILLPKLSEAQVNACVVLMEKGCEDASYLVRVAAMEASKVLISIFYENKNYLRFFVGMISNVLGDKVASVQEKAIDLIKDFIFQFRANNREWMKRTGVSVLDHKLLFDMTKSKFIESESFNTFLTQEFSHKYSLARLEIFKVMINVFSESSGDNLALLESSLKKAFSEQSPALKAAVIESIAVFFDRPENPDALKLFMTFIEASLVDQCPNVKAAALIAKAIFIEMPKDEDMLNALIRSIQEASENKNSLVQTAAFQALKILMSQLSKVQLRSLIEFIQKGLFSKNSEVFKAACESWLLLQSQIIQNQRSLSHEGEEAIKKLYGYRERRMNDEKSCSSVLAKIGISFGGYTIWSKGAKLSAANKLIALIRQKDLNGLKENEMPEAAKNGELKQIVESFSKKT